MISILMPIYNGIEFAPESIPSVLQQSFKDFELLIGLNGLPEEKEELLYPIINSQCRVFSYDLPSKVVTLNSMVKEAKYDYIALLDVDDLWRLNKIEKQIPYLKDYDVVGTNCTYFGGLSGSPKIKTGEITYDDLKVKNHIINSSMIIKKEDAYWDKEFEGVEDYDMWLRLAKEGKTFYNLEDKLVWHRVHIDSAFNGKSNHLINKVKLKYT